jgi:hypothetical protein
MEKLKRISVSYFERLNELHCEDSFNLLKGHQKKWAVDYFGNVMKRMIAIDGIQEEIELLLSRMGIAQHNMMIKVVSIEELIVGLKFYFISWATMKELINVAISDALDMGLAEKHVSYSLLMSCAKFKRTDLPSVLQKHSKEINHPNSDQSRNLAAHEGKLSDLDVVDLKKRRDSTTARRYSLLCSNPINDEEYKSEMKVIQSELYSLVSAKKEEYSEHYKKTVDLYLDVGAEIANIVSETLKGVRV